MMMPTGFYLRSIRQRETDSKRRYRRQCSYSQFVVVAEGVLQGLPQKMYHSLSKGIHKSYCREYSDSGVSE
jgi:hypothetical protein